MRIPSHRAKQHISVAVDNCIFTVLEGKLEVLLVQMKKRPFTGKWALPGGLIGEREAPEVAARRILLEETGVRDVYLEQLYTFGDPKRDPLGRVISVAYLALMDALDVTLRTTAKYSNVRWWNAAKLPKLAYDHADIVRHAVARLRAKLSYTNVAWSLLPDAFTLSDLQRVYESVLGRKLDKRNFRKRLETLKLVVPMGKQTQGGAYRPAMLYQFISRKPRIAEMI